jgi:hypothetical protein
MGLSMDQVCASMMARGNGPLECFPCALRALRRLAQARACARTMTWPCSWRAGAQIFNDPNSEQYMQDIVQRIAPATRCCCLQRALFFFLVTRPLLHACKSNHFRSASVLRKP